MKKNRKEFKKAKSVSGGSCKTTKAILLVLAGTIFLMAFTSIPAMASQHQYQEEANDIGCSGDWNATYPCSNVYDNNWSTHGRDGTGNAFYYANYTKPTMALNNTSLWRVKDEVETVDLPIPDSCWVQNPLQFRVFIHMKVGDDEIYWQCWDGVWQTLRNKTEINELSFGAYEEAMWWDLDCAPYNPSPSAGAANVEPQHTIIGWGCDCSNMVYNIKFYREPYNMQMKEFVSENQEEKSWNPYVMFYNTKYYWQVTASDEGGETNTSALWNFTTRDLGNDAIEDKNYSTPFEDTFGTMNFSILQISDGVQAVYNNAIPAGLFYLFIFGMFFVGLYIRQGDVAIPALLGIILSPAVWTFVPMEYQGVTFWLLALSVAGILAAVFKSRM